MSDKAFKFELDDEESQIQVIKDAKKYGLAIMKTRPKPQTNYDLLISKTPEELARFITDDLCELFCGAPSVCDGNCEEKMLSWLKAPVEEG